VNSGDFWRRVRRDRMLVVGGIVVVIMALLAILAPVIAPHDPYEQYTTKRLLPPGREFLLGTDWAGRDLLSRLIYGARITLTISFAVVVLAGAAGVLVGLLAGYLGGAVDAVVTSVVDMLFSFPALALAMAIAVLLGVSTQNLILALAIIYSPIMVRVTRGAVLSVKEKDYVTSAIAAGCSMPRILFRYLLPNVMAPVLVQLTLGFSWTVLSEAGLTYLGFGAQAPDASWGMVLNEGRSTLMLSPWASIWAGVFIAVAVLGFNFMGDGLRDVLDPTLRNR
jgi:peptide/nickel transport system permease protein